MRLPSFRGCTAGTSGILPFCRTASFPRLYILVTLLCVGTRFVMGQWIQTNGPGGTWITDIALRGSDLLVATYGAGIFRSSDGGNSWDSLNTGLTNQYVKCLGIVGTNLYAGTEGIINGGIFRSTDDGAHWAAVNAGLAATQVFDIVSIDGNIFAGTYDGGVFLSTDEGSHWDSVNVGLTNKSVIDLAVKGRDLFAVCWFYYGPSVFLSTNNGASWTAANVGIPASVPASALVVIDQDLLAGTNEGGVYRSTDNGRNWGSIRDGSGMDYFRCMTVTQDSIGHTRIFFGGTHRDSEGHDWGVALLSTDGGSSWSDISEGLLLNSVNDIGVSGAFVFAGTGTAGVWKRPLSEITSAEFTESTTPTALHLGQNFPNPFNPRTTITYELPIQCHVSLKVYNMFGQEVAVLANGLQVAGHKSIFFNASGLPSGVYFYSLTAGESVATKKFVLLR
jgi:hypothetical protein